MFGIGWGLTGYCPGPATASLGMGFVEPFVMVVSSEHEITLFDSVGFALEDFAILRLIYDLAGELGLGSEIDLIPEPVDPKNLFGVLDLPNRADSKSAINFNVR